MRAAIDEAVAFRFGAVQIFTRNQRQWTPKALEKDEIAEFHAARKGTVFEDGARIVSHNSYLINLASPDATNLAKSMACERAELERRRPAVRQRVNHERRWALAVGARARHRCLAKAQPR